MAGVAAGVLVGTAWVIWFGPEPQPRATNPHTPQPQPAPTPTTTPGGMGVGLAPQPQPGGFVVSVAPQTQTGNGGSGVVPPRPTATGGDMCSFTSETTVTTAHGKEAIGTLRVGDKVLAYNPKTHKLELQPILHVWTHRDQDLVDVTLTATPSAHEGKATTSTQEKLHTTSETPCQVLCRDR